MTSPTALVTGATAGIGETFAEYLAEKKYNLVIVARDQARLDERATRWSTQYGIDVEIIRADLQRRREFRKLRVGSAMMPDRLKSSSIMPALE